MPRIATRAGDWIGMMVVALGVGLALSGDASSDPISADISATSRALVSTGLVTFRADRGVRVNAAEPDPNRPPRIVKLYVKGRTGNVLAQSVQTLTPGNGAVFLDLEHADLPPSTPDALPIRAEFDFQCQGEDDPGPITTWEIFDTLSGAIEVTGSCGCPCCGPSIPPTGPMASCGDGQRVKLVSTVQ